MNKVHKYLAALLIVSLWAPPAFPWGLMSTVTSTPSSGESCTEYIICQNWEGSGADNGETWSSVSSSGQDNTSVVLRGSQSAWATLNTSYLQNTANITSQTTYWVFFRWQTDNTASGGQNIITLRDTGDKAYISKISGGAGFRIYSDNAYITVALAPSNNTEYCIWATWTKGAGSNNGTAQMWIDPCASRCSGGTCTRGGTTNSTATGGWDSGDAGSIGTLRLVGATTSNSYWDQVYIDDAEITDVPD